MAHPDRLVINDRMNEMFDRIYHDIEDGIAPIDDFGDMFRDFSGHATEDYGQFFLHNALRRAFGQPIGVDNSTLGVDDPFVRNYLSYIVFIHPAPEPGSQIPLSAGLVLLLGLD